MQGWDLSGGASCERYGGLTGVGGCGKPVDALIRTNLHTPCYACASRHALFKV